MAVSLLYSATALQQVWSREPAAEIAQAGTASASEKKTLPWNWTSVPRHQFDKGLGPTPDV